MSTHKVYALQVWDNAARMNLPIGLKLWLGFLVGTALFSMFFVKKHPAARWVLAGFVASHLLIAAIGAFDLMILRKGQVSLAHLIFWSPGLIAVIKDRSGRAGDPLYRIWSTIIIMVIFIAFVFDIRDSVSYILHASTP